MPSRPGAGGLPRTRGFTLVELLLVMVVMVAAISVCGPSLSNFFRGRTLDSEARRLLALTHAGQDRAVSEGIPMRLWVDVEQKAYGLKEEPGWDENDPKEVEFELDKDLKLAIVKAEKSKKPVGQNGRPTAQFSDPRMTAGVQDTKASLPQIRFLPDGAFEEGSPRAIQLTDRDGFSVWIAQASDRSGYEIRQKLE